MSVHKQGDALSIIFLGNNTSNHGDAVPRPGRAVEWFFKDTDSLLPNRINFVTN